MKKKISLSLFVLVILAALISWAVLSYNYSNGVRAGRLVKLSKKGMLIKTYEGTLDLGSGDLLTWDFSVHDNKVGDALVKHSGKEVRLHYDELLWKVFYGTKYNVTKFGVKEDGGGLDLLCRMVNVLRLNKEVVDKSRSLIMESDPELLNFVRKCQN